MMIFNKKQRKLSSRRIKKLGVLFFTAVFVFTVFVMAVPVSAEGSTIQVSYVNRYWNGEKVVSSTEKANCSVITANTTDLQNGWYVVDSDLTIKCRIEVSGTVNLVLRDGKTLNVVGGLHLKDGVVLNVYGQSNDSGLLNATEPGSNKAAIGGNKNQSGRTINVYGGKINAVAGKYAAAIGGGYEGRGPTFTIYGGSVIAEAENDGAAIGSGSSSSAFDNVKTGSASYTMYGGYVHARNIYHGVGVGGGMYSDGIPIRIFGGSIDASGHVGPFGHGYGGSGDYTLEIYDTAKVRTGAQGFWIPKENRESRIKATWAASIDPCDHKSNSEYKTTYTTSKAGHIIHCPYCYVEKRGEFVHEYNGNQCKVCKYQAESLCTIHFDKNSNRVSGNMTDLKADKGAEITMIDHSFNAPADIAMHYWQVGDDSSNRIVPGEQYTVTESVTLKAVWNGGLCTERQLQRAIAQGGVVKLEGDIRLSSPVVIEAGKSVVLDLNGHKLYRSLKTDSVSGHVIEVSKNGNLTIMNSDKDPLNAEISGGRGTYGGGIRNDGTVTIKSRVNITGNGTDPKSGVGGGIYNTGTIFIEGGTITENQAYMGGGIYNTGTMYMHGGQLKENEARYAGGIWQGGTIAFSGKVWIDDNPVGGNIYIDPETAGGEVIIDGELGDSFHVSFADPEAFGTSGYKNTNGGRDPQMSFVDDSGVAKASLLEESGEVVLTVDDNASYYVENEGMDDGRVTGIIKGISSPSGREYQIIESSDTDENVTLSKWNVVREDATISAGLGCDALKANIIICDGATLTVNGGISIGNNCTLNIYGQLRGTGKLVTKTNIEGTAGISGGTIIIHGVNVEAKGGKYAAGIGSGDRKDNASYSETGMIRLLGSTIIAEGGEYAAGIGGGRKGNGRMVEIYDSVVTAKGGKWGAGIGSGDEAKNDTGDITIYSGTIKANGGREAAGIGGGNECGCGYVTIYDGEIQARGGKYGAGIGSGDEPSGKTNNIFIHGGVVKAVSSDQGAGIGGGNEGSGGTIYIDGGSIEAYCDGEYGAGIGGGDRRSGGNITIAGGSVTARTKDWGAGIGSGYEGNSGNITISGGDVTVFSSSGPGIGAGGGGHIETINISGGTVQAFTDTSYSGAPGIGTSGEGAVGSIVISGGVVYAEGGDLSAGIGTDDNSDLKEIIISGGHVTSIGGMEAPGIGNGRNGVIDTITISGGTVIATAGNDYGGAITMHDVEQTSVASDIKIYDKAMVKAGNSAGSATKVEAAKRANKCYKEKYAEISPCNHERGTISSQGDAGHTITCSYCKGTSSAVEPHSFDASRKCTVCGYQAVEELCTITFDPGTEEATGVMEQITLPKGTTFVVPDCDFVFAGHSFNRWWDGTETFRPSNKITLTENMTLTATWVDYPWRALQEEINRAPDDILTTVIVSCYTEALKDDVSLVIPQEKKILLVTGSRIISGRYMEQTMPVIEVRGTLTISGRGTISGGKDSGIKVFRGGKLILQGPDIVGNKGVSGGGIYLDGGATLIMESGEIKGNTATNRGGGIYASGADVTISGGIFERNQSGGDGGGICLERGNITISGCTIENNKASGNGGGLYLSRGTSERTVTDAVITGNTAKDYGGGIFTYYTALSTTRCDVSGNAAFNGGGAYNYEGTLEMNDCSVSENLAYESGGGIYNTGTLNISGGSIQFNTAKSIADPDETAAAGGITNNGSISVSGNIHVTDNRLNGQSGNIYVQSGKTIAIADKLDGQARIGVTAYCKETDGPVIITSGLNGKDNNGANGSADNFLSDDAQYFIDLSEDGEAQIVEGTRVRVHFDPNGGTGSMKDEWADVDEDYPLPDCDFEAPQGKFFAGWLVGDAEEALAEGTPIQLKEETVVKAKWADTHSVTILHESDMHAEESGGALVQSDLAGSMEPVTFETNDSYYFPKDYASLGTSDGITVKWVSYNMITVSGVPTADVELKLAAASERPRAETPNATFTATGPDTGVLGNIGPDIVYRFGGGEIIQATGTSESLDELDAGIIFVYRLTDLEYGLDSLPQGIEVIRAPKPDLEVIQPEAGTKGSVATTDEHEYSTDGEDWTHCSGILTDLDPGTYFVRVRAQSNRLASEPQEIVIEHLHDWSYELSGDGATITAKCGVQDCGAEEELIVSAPDGGACTYDGQPKEAALNGDYSKAAFPSVSGIEYYQGDTRLDTAPVNAGSYRARVTVGTGDETVTAYVDYEINKADPAVEPPVARNLVYNGRGQELVTAGSAEGGELLYALGSDDQNAPDDGWDTSIPVGEDVGTYYVWYKAIGDSNHNDAGPELCMTMIKLDAPDDFGDQNKPKAIQGLEYNGREQQLVTEPTESYSGCTINYSIDGGRTWFIDDNNDPALPVAVNAGKYIVTAYYAMPDGTRDFIETVEVAIMPRPVTIVPDEISKSYGEEDPELRYTAYGLLEGDALTGSLAREEGEDAGTYEFLMGTLTMGEKDRNYDLTFDSSPKFTIEPRDVTSPIILLDRVEFPYTGRAIMPDITVYDGTTVIPQDEYGMSFTGDNINAGSSRIGIKDLPGGNYSFEGIEYAVFKIVKAEQVITAEDVTASVGDTGKVIDASTLGEDEDIILRFAVTEGDDIISVDAESGALVLKAAGKATVTITASESANYLGATEQVTVTVSDKHTHDWGAATYVWSADNSTVTATRVCTKDDSHVEKETVSTTSKVTKPATCIDKGEVMYTSSAFENAAFEVQTKTEVIAASGHKWDDGEVTKEATETAEGVRTFTCTVCGDKKTELIPKKTPGGADDVTPASEPAPAPGSDPNQKGKDGTAVGEGASAASAEKAITTMKNDNDLPGSVYSRLRLRSPKQTKSSITLSWTKNSKAVKYVIYGNKCGKKTKPKKIATVKSKNTKVFRKVAGKKLKKGTYYKFIIVALDKNNNVVSTSKLCHVATTGGKYCNHKSVTVKKSVINKAKKLKKGKTLKLNAKAVKQSKKLKVSVHRVIKYESTNKKIATVSKSGKVKAKKKGSCYIYAYAQNGVFRKVKIIVK